MSANIFPIRKEEADKHHWVVRCLRYYGYLITTAAMIFGFYVGSGQMSQIILLATEAPKLLVVCVSTLIAGIFGLALGLLVSLPFWAISMALDDLHATRQYMQGFVILDGKSE